MRKDYTKKTNKYQEVITKMTLDGQLNYRYKMVKFALANGNKCAAREFNTSPYIVRKWRIRYEKEGLRSLMNSSRKPLSSPNKCPQDFEDKVIKIRTETKHKYGAVRLIDRFDLEYGKSCIQRIINEHGLKSKTKKKREKRNELWSIKRLTKLFDKIQVDVKILTDIPQYWNAYHKNALPQYEFTARDVKTGATFVCYAKKNNSANAATFLCYIMTHLKEHGFDLGSMIFQMDNGAEFFACGNKKNGKTPVEKVIEDIYHSNIGRIPPASPTFNSDVETFHRLVEYEFYDIEDIDHLEDLQAKMHTFLIDFNYLRKNSYKDFKTPLSLAREDFPYIPYDTFSLLPIVLDDNQHLYYDQLNLKSAVSSRELKLFKNNPAGLKILQTTLQDAQHPRFLPRGGNDVSWLDKCFKNNMFRYG